jgi:hypothetical protein
MLGLADEPEKPFPLIGRVMRLTGWSARFAGLALLCLSLSCGDSVGPRVPANIVIVPNQPVVSRVSPSC